MPLARSSQRVEKALREVGLSSEVRELPASTRSAAEAADALGCSVAQIAKSLIFRTVTDARAVLIIASGANRVDEARVAAVLGTPIVKADADYVRAATGYAIGGVPAIGHARALTTLVDRDLLQYETVWAAAGTPRTVCELPTQSLATLTGGQVTAIG